MKRLAVTIAAAAVIAAAIPAEAATTGGKGDTGKDGRPAGCFVSTNGKHARTCGTGLAGQTGNAGNRPFFLP
jgi:hypothetical protein